MWEDIGLEQKTVKNTRTNPAIRKKNVTGGYSDVFTVFLGEHVKSLRQQWEETSYVQSWVNIFRNDRRENQFFSELIQYCSEFIRVYSMEQNNVGSFVSLSGSSGGGGGAGRTCKE